MIPQVKIACSNPEHSDEFACYFCKRQQCMQNNPICVLCAYSSHKDHKLEPLKIILKKIQQDAKTYSQNLSLFAQVDLLKQKLYLLCKKVPQQNLRNLIHSSIDHYLSKLMSKIQVQETDQLKKLIWKFEKQDPKTQKQILNKVIKYQKKNAELENQILSQQNKNISNFAKILKGVIQTLSQAVQSFQQAIKKQQFDISILQIFTPGVKKFHFTPKLKHTNLTINDETSIKMQDQYATYNYMALCSPKLSYDKIQKITFNMVTLTSYITVGVCKKDKISSNFQFNSSQSGHGTYQISFDGFAWCDENPNVNQQETGWYFNQGDKVTIEFNPKAKKLKFYKNNNEEENFQTPMQFSKNQKLYFCVSMNTKPQEIHIID